MAENNNLGAPRSGVSPKHNRTELNKESTYTAGFYRQWSCGGEHKRELVCNPTEQCTFWKLSYLNISLESANTIAPDSEQTVVIEATIG